MADFAGSTSVTWRWVCRRLARFKAIFAATKPPFDFALGRPEGEVWLQRPRAEENAAYTYDVFDSAGKWHRAVTFPTGTALAGFGRNEAVYVTVKAADGTKTVGRMKLK